MNTDNGLHLDAQSCRFRRTRGFVATALIAALTGCTYVREQPEIEPDRYAPAIADQPWTPAREARKEYVVPIDQHSRLFPGEAPGASLRKMSLAALIDVGLTNNPATRRSWESARAAAAAYGASKAPYYPLVSTETDASYQRLLFQVNPGPAVISQWTVAPMIQLTYTLADFGRRSAEADIARFQLSAANFTFNRTMQDVVFGVQRSFYALAAAEASVVAAQQNLALAVTDLDAVAQRVDLGLATQPALLLARERKAQAAFELENARTLVNDSRANLAVAVGVAANEPFEVEALQNQSVPKSLGREVDDLIASAIRDRPDLSAEVAKLRESEAVQARAHADWFPIVGLGANYSQQSWWYNYNSLSIIKSSQPQYLAQVGLKWDIFTGFRRLNNDRRAEAENRAQRESVRSLKIATIAEVWRSYYDFQTAEKKYEFAEALLAAAKESYDDNLETYRQGLSTIVELLTADRDLANARFTMIQSTADLLTSSAAVAYAVGAIERPHP